MTTYDAATGERAGPVPAVGDLYGAHRLALVRLALLLVDDRATAEDVVQEAFAGYVRRQPRVADADAALAYLRRSVVNGSRSVLRRRRTRRAHTPPLAIAPDGPADLVLLDEEHREVMVALAALAPRQREVLVLRFWSGLAEAEIALALGISAGTVKSTASRALANLEKNLEVTR